MRNEKTSPISQEGVDKMGKIDVNQWREKKIKDAVEKFSNSKSFSFADDSDSSDVTTLPISKSFGESYATKVGDDLTKKGFVEIGNEDGLQIGDLYRQGTGGPLHMYIGDNKNGKKVFMSINNNGKPSYIESETGNFGYIYDKNKMSEEEYNELYKPFRYRFNGSEEEIAEIDKHNRIVDDWNKSSNSQRVIPQIQIDTVEWLSGLPKRK